MSKPLLLAAAVALAAFGLILSPADAQQKPDAAAKRFAPVKPTGGPIAPTQFRPNKSVTSSPKALPLKAPQIPNNWQPELQPPAFGPKPLYIPKAKIAGYVPAPVSANKPSSANGPSQAKRATKQRPMGPGHQPAGNPWIAQSRENMPQRSVNPELPVVADHIDRRLDRIVNSRIDPAIRGLRLGAGSSQSAIGRLQPAGPANNQTGRFPSLQSRPTGPAGNAAPAIGNRGFAADGPGPNFEQQTLIWESLVSDSQGPNPTVYRMGDQFYTVNSDGKTFTYWSFNNEGNLTTFNEATSRERTAGPHGEVTETVVLEPVKVEGSPNTTEQSEKKVGPKHSLPGAEGTDGDGVAGGAGSRLPQRVDRGDIRRGGPPASVIKPIPIPGEQPTDPNFKRPEIAAPEFNRGGYIPTAQKANRGKDKFIQPAVDQERMPSSSEPRALERLRDPAINPIPTP